MPAMNNAHALVIGIANYQQINKLPPIVLKDAQDIYDLLIDPQHCGYLSENVELLLDDHATQAALRQAMSDLASRSDKNASIFLYLSSHGGQVESGSHAGEYILPVDVVYKSNRSITETAISGDEFTQALRAIPACKVVVVFDCCHSGGIGQPKDAKASVLKRGFSEGYYDDALKTGTGRVILAASRSSEDSWVLPGAENSLFTQHFLSGMRGGIASDDGLIRIFDLFEYIQPRVTSDQPNQHPIFKAELEENFPVSLYLGGKKGVIPKDEQGFRYDAYISYADIEPDKSWVRDTLLKRLGESGLRIALSKDVEEGGVDRVVTIERGIKQSKRTIIALSDSYLSDYWAGLQNVLAMTLGIQEGAYRLLPIKITPFDESQLPTRLSMLATLDLTDPSSTEREFDRLVQALQGPLPHR